jgi:23S rRNA (uridine2552-2'-O)-methyltransferase
MNNGTKSGPPAKTGNKGIKTATVTTGRAMKQRLKTARGRTVSQQRWLERQLNDPYVKAAKSQGYRSRAAFKLAQMDDKAKLLKPGMKVLDLGAAPGGWSQVAAERVRAQGQGSTEPGAETGAEPQAATARNTGRGAGHVVAVDLTPVEPIAGVTILELDFMSANAEAIIEAAVGGLVDGVMSDMAAPSTGHKMTDHLRIIDLCEAAMLFAVRILKPGGFFICKVLQGGSEGELLVLMKRNFRSVKHIKPGASRADSSELYVLATGFRGGPSDAAEPMA